MSNETLWAPWRLGYVQGHDKGTPAEPVEPAPEPAEIVAAPRIHHQYLPDTVMYESAALGADERADLEKRGHKLRESKTGWGNTQVVTWDYASGRVEAASDPRGFGAGLVY